MRTLAIAFDAHPAFRNCGVLHVRRQEGRSRRVHRIEWRVLANLSMPACGIRRPLYIPLRLSWPSLSIVGVASASTNQTTPSMGALFSSPGGGGASPTHCGLSGVELRRKYDALASQLQITGFDATAMARAEKAFVDGRPRRYREPPWSLPPDAVRVLALPMDDLRLTDAASRRTSHLALRAATAVAGLLPRGSQFWLPDLGTLHCTIFHPGVSPAALSGSTNGVTATAVSESAMRLELDAARHLAASMRIRNLSLTVDRRALIVD